MRSQDIVLNHTEAAASNQSAYAQPNIRFRKR
eukprot:SAG31_NODE_14542_length_800_cov_1.253923_3_plen_31_part_01